MVCKREYMNIVTSINDAGYATALEDSLKSLGSTVLFGNAYGS